MGRRREGQVIVGFAAETTDVEAHAVDKLRRKGVDLLVVNDVAAPGAGFEHPTNEVVLLGRDEVAEHVSMRSKEEVAMAIRIRSADDRSMLQDLLKFLPHTATLQRR